MRTDRLATWGLDGDVAEVAIVEAHGVGSALLVGRTRKWAAFREPHAGAIAAPRRRRVPRAQGRNRAPLGLESLQTANAPSADGGRGPDGTVGHVGPRAHRHGHHRNIDESRIERARDSELGELHERGARDRRSGTAVWPGAGVPVSPSRSSRASSIGVHGRTVRIQRMDARRGGPRTLPAGCSSEVPAGVSRGSWIGGSAARASTQGRTTLG